MAVADYDTELSRIVEQLNSAASAPPGGEAGVSTESLDRLLAAAARRHASDLLLIAGSGIVMRVDGELTAPAGPELSGEDIRNLVLPLLSPGQYEELRRRRSADISFVRPEIGRFRLNIHHQRGTLAASFRLLPGRIPSIDSLNLPAILKRLCDRRQGLVLVTGPTGCGKSSTLAAMVDRINTERRCHIVTIEDPVEFDHPNRNSLIEQIEVGRDTPDFAGTVRSVLRQSPDVILVGEMRDAETIATVLTAAETGHLVFSTLHTNDTSQAVSRILDSFPTANQPQTRQQLSLALAAIIAEQLVPTADGAGRVPALEIMIATDAIRNLIRKGLDHQLRSQVATARADGMMTMEQSLADLVRRGRITRDAALAHCLRVDELEEYLSNG